MEVKQTSAIEQYIIDKVREKRKALGISQRELENRADFAGGFVGKVESPNHRAKYNFNHVNAISKVLNCKVWDLVPEYPLQSKRKR